MTKKKSSTIMLTIVLAISAIALSACNQVPEEYKIKNFYGTYNQFAVDTYDVIEVSGDRAVIGQGSEVTCAININNITKV